MKKNNKYFQLLCITVVTVFSLTSCLPYGQIPADPYIVDESRQKENIYYIPSAPNVPLLTEKNDLNLNILNTSGSKISGIEIQTAYMPGKHIGIIGSYHTGNINGNHGGKKYNRFEIGSGYVTPLSKGWHFETYAGFGNGQIFNTHHTGNSKLTLTHFFLQPSMAISNNKKTVQFGFVSRFEAVNFKVMDTSFNNEREPFTTSQIKSLYAQPFHVMWQPGFVFRFGWKNFLFHSSYSFSSDLTNPDLNREKGNFSLGASFRLNTNRKNISK